MPANVPAPDERLATVTAARSGDTSALERLLRLYQPDIRRYAQRHCMISDVDDAVQEVLWSVSRKIGSVRARAAFSGWLFAVVRRECRRLGRRAFDFDPYDEERVDRWLATRTSDTLRIELVAALESLPADYRDVILLRDFEELTIGEIAERLGMTVAATKSRLHRARMMAREYLLAEV
ncbi:sigma-70 family RNA polymerase sigma factor [Paraburkholderia sp. C35]|uniref:RNA polymerase sigma factor n=1 Tax=Paraburkholderia sp. C35 TaxID=2126993 RepID=UPI000D69662B|nr:sigma-70 family RNA polymerase sigma factor [Paraburkholderia sp. C35]